MIVYLIRCLINGKGYVGQTIRPFQHRWREHCREGKGLLGRAILKYGAENFEHCILASASSLHELNRLEEYHIKLQNTIHPLGYNLVPGGRNHTHHTLTKLQGRQRQLERGWKPSAEMMEKQKLAVIGISKGPEHRARIAQSNLGKKDVARVDCSKNGNPKIKEDFT